MAVNKIEINGEVKLDLTQDTVTPATLAKGKTAHDKSGAAIVGTMEASSAKEEQEKTITITANGTVEITPDAGKTLSKATAIVNVPTSGGGSPMNKETLYAYIKANGVKITDGMGMIDIPSGVSTIYAGFKDAYGNVNVIIGWRDWELYTFPPSGAGTNSMYWYYDSSTATDYMDFNAIQLESVSVASAEEWNNVPDSYKEETGYAYTTAVEGYYILV